MSRMSFGLTIGLIALSATSFGQIPQLNFTSYQIDMDVSGANRTGMLIGSINGATTVWSPTQGLQTVASVSGDSYQVKVSDSGSVYGTSNGKIIGWNANGGRSELINQAGTNFSLVSTTNDVLLVKGSSLSGTQYYTYQVGVGLHQIQSTNPDFAPTMVGADGSIYGTVPGGLSAANLPGFLFSKLNANGTTTVDPRSILTYSGSLGGSNISQIQDFNFQSNGATVIRTGFSTSGHDQNGSTSVQDVYGNNGSHYQLEFDSAGFASSSSFAGLTALSVLADGTAFGFSSSSFAPPVKRVFDAAHPNGVALDASNYAPGSIIPNEFIFGNDKVLVGRSQVDGHQMYSFAYLNSPVPEPASLFAVGLGATALIKAKKKNR